MAISKQQAKNLKVGDRLVRRSGGKAEVHDYLEDTKGNRVYEVDAYWGDETRLMDMYAIRDEFSDIM